MSETLRNAGLLLGRVLMALLFFYSGAAKLADHGQAVAYIVKVGFPLPELAYGVAVATEILGAAVLVLGLRTGWIAAWLAIYSVWTAMQVHFQPDNTAQMISFFKNLCMAGGFLHLIACGGGRWSLDAYRGRS